MSVRRGRVLRAARLYGSAGAEGPGSMVGGGARAAPGSGGCGDGGGAALGRGAGAGLGTGRAGAAAVGGGGGGRGAAAGDAEGATGGERRAPGPAAAAERARDGGAAGGGRDRRQRSAAAGAVAEVTSAPGLFLPRFPSRDRPPPVTSPEPSARGPVAPGPAGRLHADPFHRSAPRPLPALPAGTSGASMMEPGPQAGAGAPVPVKPPLFGGCWSCRLLSGAGLLLAALWIYQGPRRSMKRGVPPSMAAIAQITFAISVGAWGAVILVDPVGKQLRKNP